MAERRMIARKIVDSDLFLGMPITTQNLYFHLSMRADDDGFINNVKSIMAMVRANEDDLRVLIQRQYVIPFESGIIVITHWRVNNYLRKGRCTETQYLAEKQQLIVANDRPYQLKSTVQQNPELLPPPDQETTAKATTRNKTPTLDEIKTFCQERGSTVDPQKFYDYYSNRKWHIGKAVITDWQAKVIQWEENQQDREHSNKGGVIDYDNE